MARSEPDQLWSALVDVYQPVLREVVDALESGAGIDSGTYSALAYLVQADPSGRLALGELGSLMRARYSQPGMSRLVQRMEADGLVGRRTDRADGRVTVVVLTRRGRSRWERAHVVYREALEAQLGLYARGSNGAALTAALEALATELDPSG